MIRKLFFSLLFFVPAVVLSQGFYPERDDIYYHRGQIVQDSLMVFFGDNVKSYPLNDIAKPVARPIYSELFDHEFEDAQNGYHAFKTINVNDALYFIQRKGGMVFKFENDSIKRIDRSFTHRMQMGSKLLSRDDKIYRYGGYGFWSMRNFFTYFSTEFKEWEAESPVNSSEFPPGTTTGFLTSKGDQAIVFGGFKQDPNDLQNSKLKMEKAWRYDFKAQKWKELGPLINEVLIELHEIEHFREIDDELLLLDKQNRLVRILPFENKVSYYKLTNLQLKIFRQFSEIATYKNEGDYYSFIHYDNIRKVELTRRNEDEFFGELLYETKLYQDLSPYRYLLLLLLIPLAILLRNLMIKFKSNNAKIKVNGEGLIYKRVFFEFEEKELEVINLLLDYDVVHSSDILALVENPNHNYSHNMRTKNQLIDKINYKLKTMLKVDHDLITSEKSKEDRRIIDYTMDKTYF